MVQILLRRNTIALFAFVIGLFALLNPYETDAKAFKTKAESAIIIDVNTGSIIYAKNENEALPPASMTKMMTEYLVLEKISAGAIDWETSTQISDFVFDISANNNFSGVGLRKNVDYTVKELYEAMAINSDNATSIALAELISGSEGEFVKLMNQKAEELGLTDYKFVNSTGLDNASLSGRHPEGTKADDTNLMSAKATALLAYHLTQDFPESLEISGVPKTNFDGQEILNWNWMLAHDAQYLKDFYYKGVDGIKTGHTDLAGYTFTSTAERDGRRLITVVMKTGSIEERFKETAKLLDYGFSQFEEIELFPAGYNDGGTLSLDVIKGKEESADLALADPIKLLIKKGTEEEYSLEYRFESDKMSEEQQLIAPIEKGEVVGAAILTHEDKGIYPHIVDGEVQVTSDIITTSKVEKKNFFSLMLDAIGSFFSNLGNKIKNIF